MLRGMTAYAKNTFENDTFVLNIEMSSVNGRFLDIALNLPKELQAILPGCRSMIAKKLFRGNIRITASIRFLNQFPGVIQSDKAFVKKYLDTLITMAQTLNVPVDSKDLFLKILDQDGIVQITLDNFDNTLYREHFFHTVEKAVDACIQMKEEEGKTIASDFLFHLLHIEKNLQEIEQKLPLLIPLYRKKLEETLSSIRVISSDNEERLIKEVVLFSKQMQIDTTEECLRAKHHIQAARDLIGEEGPYYGKGKKIEFILQELLREVNTMGAKSQDIEITRHTIEIKGAIEKMREQVQNVE